MRTVIEVLSLTTDFLKQKGIDHPRRQAEELVGEALGLGRMGVYLEHDRPVSEIELKKCREWLKRRANGEPLQYIMGEVEFYGCQLTVSQEVLIPRQETEILVDKIAVELSAVDSAGKVLLDLCCGSGAIGIALKKKLPYLHVLLSDLSEAAVAVAKQNAVKADVEVEVFTGDLLAPFVGKKADFIVCNPPYISEKEYASLDVEVRHFEPRRALVGGETGLEFYERLASELPSYLHPGAKVWFEIGHDQGEGVKALYSASCWVSKKVENDWSGKNRFFSLEFE